MSQSSIEWLINCITEDQMIKAKSLNEWILLFQQAKEMHKQEIMDAWYNGFEENRPYVDHSEDYYNKTFNNNENGNDNNNNI